MKPKPAPQSIVDLCYLATPREQGQPHQTKWAYDETSERLIRRTFDWDEDSHGRITNLRFEYRSYEIGKRGEFDPINGRINPIGKGRHEGTSAA